MIGMFQKGEIGGQARAFAPMIMHNETIPMTTYSDYPTNQRK